MDAVSFPLPSSKIILVVDDSKLNRLILSRIIKQDGYSVVEAANGQEALDIINGSKYEVSLVLLDIAMPVMDGYGVLQNMNLTGALTSIPVIVTTGNDDDGAEIRCLENGASDFIRKPYNAELVRHRIGSMLRLWENAALICQLENDLLTGVYAKEFFFRRAESELLEHPDAKYIIAYTDVDDFKMINARYGNSVGDELLKYLGELFKTQAGEGGVCGRMGGDNFVLLLKDYAVLTQKEAGERYREVFSNIPVKGFQLKCGVYPVDDRSLPVSDMCDRAKIAMTTIKKKYGVYYAVYNDAMRQKAVREHLLADRMEEALDNNEFVVYLQPKHCTESGAVAGAEALVRWDNPELGFLPPSEFVPLFERSGFIAKLDYYIWDRACRVIRSWMDGGVRPVPISVNASRADFVSIDLPDRIEKLVDSYGIPHELFHVEVTESAYTDNPQQMIDAVSALRDMGFRIEMDDFGSGYSSLNMLSELPIDVLKLDMRFMQNGNDSIKGGKRNILSFVVSLSKWLQLDTVAEGVETKQEYEMLKSMGCNYIQGYYFAKPMPVDAFLEYMAEHPTPCKQPEKHSNPVLKTSGVMAEEDKPLILVAEDVESNRAILRELLRPYYRVVEAVNGKEACSCILNRRKELACVLLDLVMPEMDGFQVLRFMKTDGFLGEIPVVITTETGGNNELRAIKLGANSYIAKPYQPELLYHAVKKAVEEREFHIAKREFDKNSSDLYEKAYRDELTTLLNRNGLMEAIDYISPDEGCALALLDIDNLKQYIDDKGHAAGDRLIKDAALSMSGAVGRGDILAHMGGEEFAAVLVGTTEPEAALERVSAMCVAVEKTVPSDDVGFIPRCIGGATLVEKTDDLETALERADEALRKARKAESRCCLWQERK